MFFLWILVFIGLTPNRNASGLECSFSKIYKLHYICSNIRVTKQEFPATTTHLHLDKTAIRNITPGAFQNLRNLVLLNMSDNYISELPSGVFDTNVKLDILDLSYNKIESLSESLFKNLKDLHDLKLNNNRIRSLPDQIFQSQANLDTLYLSANKLDTFQKTILEPLKKPEYLDLSRNAFKCNCDLLGVRMWVESHQLKVDITCEVEQNQTEVSWRDIQTQDVCASTSMMNDSDESDKSPTSRSVIIAVSVILVILCISVIIGVLWCRRKSNRSFPTNAKKLEESSEKIASSATVDLDMLYAKVNKNNSKTLTRKQSRPESVGFYASLKEESLYTDLPYRVTVPYGDQNKSKDSQTSHKDSVYASSGVYECVKIDQNDPLHIDDDTKSSDSQELWKNSIYETPGTQHQNIPAEPHLDTGNENKGTDCDDKKSSDSQELWKNSIYETPGTQHQNIPAEPHLETGNENKVRES